MLIGILNTSEGFIIARKLLLWQAGLEIALDGDEPKALDFRADTSAWREKPGYC